MIFFEWMFVWDGEEDGGGNLDIETSSLGLDCRRVIVVGFGIK